MTEELLRQPDQLQSLALNLQIAINVLRVHDAENDAAQRAIRRVLESIHAAFLESGECVVIASEDQLFVNRERIRHPKEVSDLRALLKRIHAGGMSFVAPPEPQALGQFLLRLARRGVWDAPEECYVEVLSEELAATGGERSASQPERVYRRAIGELRSIFHDVRHRGELNARRARRLVGDVIETLVSERTVMFSLMAIRDYDLYTFQHSVNVCILSSALGLKLGMERRTVRELGMAALFHDVGKLEVPRKILNKPGRLSAQEWEIMKMHPMLGARMLLAQRGLEPSMVKAVQVAIEHHCRFDGSGYPALAPGTNPSLFAQIVSVCDAFDAMTSVRVYREEPVTPGRAMSFIWFERGRSFAPALVKSFVSVLGAYPPGSLVRLSDETLAVTVDGPRGTDVFRPVVRRWKEQHLLDLSVMPGLSVVACLDPAGMEFTDAELHAHLRHVS